MLLYFYFFLLFESYFFSICYGAFRNVLFIVVDDLRPAIGVYKGEALTPNLDSLANSSAVFHNAYAQMALCAPSRNSLLTSRRPDTIRLYDFYSYWREAAGNFTTLPQYLKESGYDTYSIGKVFHPGESSNFSDDAPYSWSNTPWHPPTDKYKDSPVCLKNGSWHTNIVCPVRLEEQPGKTLPDIESTAEAIRVLHDRQGSEKPFFLSLGYHKPHVPLKFPQKYIDLYPLDKVVLPAVRTKPAGMPVVSWNPWNDLRWRDDVNSLNISFPYGPIPDDWARRIRQSYFAAVSYVDDLIGQVLNALRDSGLEANTVVVVVGDHGWSLGEHGEWSKYSNFDVSVKVPLIIKVPRLATGQSIKNMVELVDIFPSLVELLGFPSLPFCDKHSNNVTLCSEGVSFLPLLVGRQGKKKAAFSQYPRPGLTPTKHPDSDRPKVKDIQIMGYSVKTKRYRYTMWVAWRSFTPDWSDVKGTEFYDHFIDPNENVNLAGTPGLEWVENRLKNRLQQSFSL